MSEVLKARAKEKPCQICFWYYPCPCPKCEWCQKSYRHILGLEDSGFCSPLCEHEAYREYEHTIHPACPDGCGCGS